MGCKYLTLKGCDFEKSRNLFRYNTLMSNQDNLTKLEKKLSGKGQIVEQYGFHEKTYQWIMPDNTKVTVFTKKAPNGNPFFINAISFAGK